MKLFWVLVTCAPFAAFGAGALCEAAGWTAAANAGVGFSAGWLGAVASLHLLFRFKDKEKEES